MRSNDLLPFGVAALSTLTVRTWVAATDPTPLATHLWLALLQDSRRCRWIPRFDGAIRSQEWKKALCNKLVTGVPLPDARQCLFAGTRGNIAQIQTHGRKLFLCVGLDRTSKVMGPQLVVKDDRKTALGFLHRILAAVPCQIHTSLTENGIQFAEPPRSRTTTDSGPMRFDMICDANEIEHQLTKPSVP